MITNENNTGISYEEMLKAGTHFGRKKTVFNPGMGKFVFTVRDGICIIDLLKTRTCLQDAVDFLKKSIQDGKLVLFVAPTKQSHDSVKALALAVRMPYVLDRWLGGTLTNFKVIHGRVKRLEEMEAQKASGELEKYTKKERLLFDRELAKMSKNFEGLKLLTKIPDAVFVASFKEGHLSIREALRTHVPVISITNTDANPADIVYPIPANDRSKKSVDLIIDYIRQELSGAVSPQ